MREGSISGVQVEAVVDAVAADPTAAASLVRAAGRQSVADLRKTCRWTRMEADPDRAATRARHFARRSFRAWTESDGEWRALLSGPADHGARIEAALRGEHDRLFRAAHAEGRREEDACYRFDALLTLIERGADPRPGGTGTSHGGVAGGTGVAGADGGGLAAQAVRPSGRQTKVIVRVDAAALKRGAVVPGETCEIAGVGPVSLDAVAELIPSAHIAYVVRNGVDVSVAHLGRQATAHQRTALEARGYRCEVPDCGSTHLLEIDHVADWAWSKVTVLALLAMRQTGSRLGGQHIVRSAQVLSRRRPLREPRPVLAWPRASPRTSWPCRPGRP